MLPHEPEPADDGILDGGAWRGRIDGREGFDSIGAGHAQDTRSADPMMHKTATVDYIIVLKGEIHALMRRPVKRAIRRR